VLARPPSPVGRGFLFLDERGISLVARIAFFIDGFNVYHALVDGKLGRYKWLDYRRLSSLFVRSSDQIVDVLYFTAYTTWDTAKMERHQCYVQALRAAGVRIVLGEFKRKDKKCRVCRQTYQTFEEKKSDVNIAIKLFEGAIKDVYDTAVIMSGDSDLIPAIEAVKETFPAKQVRLVIPIGRGAEALKNATDFHMKMKEMHLKSSQFPDVVDLGGGKSVTRPKNWK